MLLNKQKLRAKLEIIGLDQLLERFSDLKTLLNTLPLVITETNIRDNPYYLKQCLHDIAKITQSCGLEQLTRTIHGFEISQLQQCTNNDVKASIIINSALKKGAEILTTKEHTEKAIDNFVNSLF